MLQNHRLKNCPFLLLCVSVLLCLTVRPQAFAERLVLERYMMGTSVEMILWGPGRDALEEAAEQAYAEIERIERKLSVWRRDSQVSRINRSAGSRPVRVDSELYGLIGESIRISQVSNGAFDITVQGLGDLWDFHGPDFHVPAPDLVETRLERVGYRRIRLGEEDSTVFLEKADMGISLGGIAKGYAVDRAVSILRKSGVQGGIVSAGGDLFAFGRKGNGESWKVGVRNPRDHSRNISILPVSDLAVATSGDYERYRVIQGTRYHHILDPRTGYPSKGCMSVTVVAESALHADALATAAFVLGPEEGLALLEKLSGIEGFIVDSNGKTAASSGLAAMDGGARKEKPNPLSLHPKHNEITN